MVFVAGKLGFQYFGLKPPTSVAKGSNVRHKCSKPLIPSTLAGGGSVDEMISVALWITVGVFGVLE